jgi:hypothetical protein
MEGRCLVPFEVEKQTVVEMILEQLLGPATNAYYVKIDEVGNLKMDEKYATLFKCNAAAIGAVSQCGCKKALKASS